MKVLLTVINDIKEKKEGKLKSKQLQIHKVFETFDILPEQILNKKGEVLKSYCLIRSGDDYYKVKHSFDEIYKMIRPVQVKGFKRY